MSEATDIVERLRDVIALEGISVVEFRALLAEAASVIEHQRTTLANSEASAAVIRGGMGRTPVADEPMMINEAQTSTPR